MTEDVMKREYDDISLVIMVGEWLFLKSDTVRSMIVSVN